MGSVADRPVSMDFFLIFAPRLAFSFDRVPSTATFYAYTYRRYGGRHLAILAAANDDLR